MSDISLPRGEASTIRANLAASSTVQIYAIREAGSALIHFHACGSDRGAPGGDNVNWKAVRDALVDIGYRGGIAIESFTTSNTAIATATSIWRPLAESQDDIAFGGLSFLKELFSTHHVGG